MMEHMMPGISDTQKVLTVEVGKEKFCTTLGQILKLRL
jgi:hypothetical protein